MKEQCEAYISKKQAQALGYVHRSEGGYKKLLVIEKYAKRGWLSFGSKSFTDEDRVSIGLKFYSDFYHSHIGSSGVINLLMPRVDCSAKADTSENVLGARTRFFKAFRALPKLYMPCVARVVLEDRELGIARTSTDYQHQLELAKEYLCLGLDELIYHYKGRPRLSRSKIVGLSNVNIWENFSQYCEQMGL